MKESGKEPGDKKKRMITMDIKHEIIEKHERGVRVSDLANEYKRTTSTICTILKQKEAIKKLKPSKGVTIMHPSRTDVHDEMEKLLVMWIQEKRLTGETVTESVICEKAFQIYTDLKKTSEAKASENKPSTSTTPQFKASHGWFKKFKKRTGFQLGVKHEEAPSLEVAAAEKFTEYFGRLIVEEGYSPEQVFNCDETGLFWKKMPRKTLISVEESKLPGYKPMKERLSLEFCANASGDLKIKPLLVYHFDNPYAFKAQKVVKANLQVMWRANAKAWVTSQFFIEWINEVFGPSVKKYLIENEMPLKCLLLLDYAPGHPPDLQEKIHDEFNFIKVVFIPPSTTPILQPMDQQVISNFKMLYTKYLFKKCLDVTSSTNLNIQEFWKGHFNILSCLKIIEEAWQGVTQRTLNSAWMKLWPEAVTHKDYEPQQENEPTLLNEIVFLGKSMGLEVDEEDVSALVAEHSVELTKEELRTIQTVPHIEVIQDISGGEADKEMEENISTNEIMDMLVKWQEVSDFIERKHPDKLSCSNAGVFYDNTCLQHFRNILRRRQIPCSLDCIIKKSNESDKSEAKKKKIKKEHDDQSNADT